MRALPLLSVLFTVPLVACQPKVEGPTWHADISPIVQEHCLSCHVEGNIAPFALTEYTTASALAASMAAATADGSMPPFLAKATDDCTPPSPWVDDLSLSDEQIAMFAEWAANGAPEGDPADAPAPHTPPSLQIEDPDLVLPFPEAYVVPPGDRDIFQCFVLDPGNTTDTWVTEIQLVAGNTKIDHHGLVFQDVSGRATALAGADGSFPCFANPDVDGFLMATWTPGATPMRTPETAAMPLLAGAKLVVQMHYHPSSAEESDLSRVELKFATSTPTWAAAQVLLGNYDDLNGDGTGLQPGPNDDGEPRFYIPPGASDHVETMLYTQDFPLDFPLFSIGTHMHYVGTDMRVDYIDDATGAETCLIQTPNWDFNWQRTYSFDGPIDSLPKVGDQDSLRMTCQYNNTLDNRFVADALAEQGFSEPQPVHLGEETLDEMCLGLFGILVPPSVVSQLF